MIQALALALFALADAPPRIGAKIAPFSFVDTRWLSRSLDDFGEKKAFVVVFTTVDCPLAKRVLPRVAELEKSWRERGVAFLVVDVGDDDDLVEVAANAVEAGLEFPCARDFDGAVRRALQPTRSPEVCVLDAARVLRYRGRVSSEERLGGATAAPVVHDLAAALEDIVSGRSVSRPETPLEGCKLNPLTELEPARFVPDYTELVQPILAQHCVSCHAIGGSAPFELETPAGAQRHAAMIGEVVLQRRMPPWFASERYGHFANERRLTDAERRVVLAWAENGSADSAGREKQPENKPKTTSNPVAAWRIGTPDLVLESEAIRVRASGTVPYRYVVLPHLFTRDTWVERVEIRPSDPRVLHHANLGFYTLGGDVKAANFITGQVPGGDPMDLGVGTAALIPAGSVLGLQVHHVPYGVATEDVIQVGLRFPRDVVRKRMRHHEIADMRFAIPPFAPAHPVRATRTFAEDSVGIGMFVHMHLRGRDMRYDARFPDGHNETLLLVPNYDFNWQTAYRWRKDAMLFPKGTTVECLAHFDNSAFNPWNPEPEKRVTFGQETTDEMMYGFLFYVHQNEDLELAIDPSNGGVIERSSK
ncbi:MAG: redoxin family protein [Planctomycetota bacterium]|nr:redoxin family protein [Planctomycetota bacterium]